MTATIHYLNPPLREIPTQEIRSLYEDLYLEEIRKQHMEQAMMKIHDKMHPAKPDMELLLFGVLLFSLVSFLLGYLFHMIING